MKKLGHLNRDIARVLACLGHTDSIVIADCGLPVPPGVECIDVSLALGEPGFARVLDTVLADMACEPIIMALWTACCVYQSRPAPNLSAFSRKPANRKPWLRSWTNCASSTAATGN